MSANMEKTEINEEFIGMWREYQDRNEKDKFEKIKILDSDTLEILKFQLCF